MREGLRGRQNKEGALSLLFPYTYIRRHTAPRQRRVKGEGLLGVFSKEDAAAPASWAVHTGCCQQASSRGASAQLAQACPGAGPL